MKPNLILNILQRHQTPCSYVLALLATYLAGILIGLTPANMRAADPGPSNALHEAHALIRQTYLAKSNTDLEESFATFRRLLPGLAAADVPLGGGVPEEVTLVRIARGVRVKPELLDELLAVYGTPAPETMQRRVLLPKPLQPTHLTEAYRPAWEALLLAPPSTEIMFMQRRFTIMEALYKIGNPKSLPVLELAFALTCETGVRAVEGSGAVKAQFRIMECLNRFATRESLEAMLRCLARAEAASAGQLPKYSGHDLREWIERFLTDRDNYKTKEKWRQVLSTFPKSDLPASQRELLDHATRQP